MDLDYRHYLREELVARCGRNPVYSARAMARDLSVSPAFFSQILSGTRTLSEERAVALAEKIRWSMRKRRVFVKLVRLHSTSDDQLRTEVLRDLTKMGSPAPLAAKFHDLSHDEFKTIADWYHFAIVELALVCELPDDSVAVAARLGLSNVVAMQAIERLVRVGLIERSGGLLKKVVDGFRMKSVPSRAIRTFHKDQLKKAAVAIEKQDLESRDFSGTTIAINPKKLPRAKALIRRFQSDLSELLETGEKSAVYQLAIQLYRLDKDQP